MDGLDQATDKIGSVFLTHQGTVQFSQGQVELW